MGEGKFQMGVSGIKKVAGSVVSHLMQMGKAAIELFLNNDTVKRLMALIKKAAEFWLKYLTGGFGLLFMAIKAVVNAIIGLFQNSHGGNDAEVFLGQEAEEMLGCLTLHSKGEKSFTRTRKPF